jgi:hypothetical protein
VTENNVPNHDLNIIFIYHSTISKQSEQVVNDIIATTNDQLNYYYSCSSFELYDENGKPLYDVPKNTV